MKTNSCFVTNLFLIFCFVLYQQTFCLLFLENYTPTFGNKLLSELKRGPEIAPKWLPKFILILAIFRLTLLLSHSSGENCTLLIRYRTSYSIYILYKEFYLPQTIPTQAKLGDLLISLSYFPSNNTLAIGVVKVGEITLHPYRFENHNSNILFSK